ncbi:hypothetical protein O4H49_12850 [Kiloniella laminariae]|uniref:Uncharacterized protein n=1 Tax=Kiloniella laminariae TaxID=454162 RepID=A0ABT4LMU3_9PROT|nr:hypothetical protein [Kiloniella laminariae]MCZ4281671.1 hypothetical protein [Kiloniella laminariae]
MTEWSLSASQVIDQVHQTLPDDIDYKSRVKAVDSAYPFGERKHWPYKAWLAARKRYLRPYKPPKEVKHLSPLERMIERALQNNAGVDNHE